MGRCRTALSRWSMLRSQEGFRSKRVTDTQDRIISVGRNVKLEDKEWRAHTEPSRFLHRAFSPWSKERLPSPAPDRCESASRLAVYAIRMQPLWRDNSPTFLIRACLATRLSDE